MLSIHPWSRFGNWLFLRPLYGGGILFLPSLYVENDTLNVIG